MTSECRVARKPRDADLVAWSTLKVEALRLESAATLKSLNAEIEALRAHSAINEEVYRELAALIEAIDKDIDAARTGPGSAPTSA